MVLFTINFCHNCMFVIILISSTGLIQDMFFQNPQTVSHCLVFLVQMSNPCCIPTDSFTKVQWVCPLSENACETDRGFLIMYLVYQLAIYIFIYLVSLWCQPFLIKLLNTSTCNCTIPGIYCWANWRSS